MVKLSTKVMIKIEKDSGLLVVLEFKIDILPITYQSPFAVGNGKKKVQTKKLVWGPQEALNDTKLVLNDYQGVTHVHLGPIWYHSEPSDVPYCPNQFLGWGFFYCFLQQTNSRYIKILSVIPGKQV